MRVAILRLVLLFVALVLSTSTGIASAAPSAPALGPNVTIFEPSMPVSEIQATVGAIHAQQVDDEMGTNRHLLLFKPGVYGSASQPLQMKVATTPRSPGWGPRPPT